jgi:adenylate cyclase
MTIPLDTLGRCFLGVSPAVLATADRNGEPNAAFISQVFHVDSRHVAVSCQFFNKTRRNLDANPRACLLVVDPLTLDSYRLKLGFARAETEGPLFDAMALRIQAIASQTGMLGVFRLLSADVFEVQSITAVEGFMEPAPADPELGAPPRGQMSDLLRLQVISARMNGARDLEHLLSSTLEALEELFAFSHSMVLVPDDTGTRLVALASHGYGSSGIGAEVTIGDGLIGTVAARRQLLRFSGAAGMRYGRAIRGRVEVVSGREGLAPEIPLPGLPEPQSQMAIPLVVRDRLVGVLAVESRDPLCFEAWHESFLQIIGNQFAFCMDNLERAGLAEDEEGPAAKAERRSRRFSYYRNDDCVFSDGEYLVRNVPGKILWKLLTAYQRERRTEFSNRELRLDESLGLPAVKDNLESRLILLRRRLEEKCPDVAIVPVRRGRFALEVRCNLQLEEKSSA